MLIRLYTWKPDLQREARDQGNNGLLRWLGTVRVERNGEGDQPNGQKVVVRSFRSGTAHHWRRDPALAQVALETRIPVR